MAIDTKHQLWQENIYTWTAIRDCMDGEDRIKFKSQMYLPIPAAMLDDFSMPAPSTQQIVSHPLSISKFQQILSQEYNPNYHPIVAYAAYKSRARFPNLVSFLYRGLMGLASADSPSIQLPKELEYLETEYATREGLTLSRLFVKTLGEVLLTGRAIHVLDPENEGSNKILITDYKAEQFTNWRVRSGNLTQAVLVEFIDESSSVLDTYDEDEKYILLDATTGNYAIRYFDPDDGSEASNVVPSYKGRTMPYIPMTIYGALNNTIDPDPAPLAPVANTAIQIYQKDADLSQAEYLTCNPTLCITGISDDGLTKISTGPTVAFKISNPQAKVFYTETDTSALRFIHDHINSLYEQAVIYGAQLLDSSKKSAETAETARLRQTAAGATLRSVVQTVGHGFQKTLESIARWKGVPESRMKEIKFSPLTEFGSALTPQEQEQLVQSWLAGAISHQTVLSNFRKAGILGEGRTEDDELKQLQKEEALEESTEDETEDSDTSISAKKSLNTAIKGMSNGNKADAESDS